MKNKFKFFSIFAVFFLLIIFFIPSNIKAKTDEGIKSSGYKQIDEMFNLKLSDLEVSNISFYNYSNTSTKTFGMMGEIYNTSNYDVNLNVVVKYYDKEYNLISTSSDSKVVETLDSISYTQMSNLNQIKSGYTVDDIYYYNISFEIKTVNSIASATSSTKSINQLYNSYDYIIDNYNIDIVVNEDNTFNITEKICAIFNQPKHGIYRKIPLRNTVTRLDGTTSKNRARVTDIKVSDEFTKSVENQNLVIKIGSPNITLTGKQEYEISYKYSIGKDPLKEIDELYYNIIGDEWDTVINNVTFSIKMPKEFDISKLGFSSGLKGSTSNSNITYDVKENTIIGKYNGVLNPNEAMTIRLELPEGYFVKEKFKPDITFTIIIVLPIIFLIISIILWVIYGKDKEVVETVEFYPPDGFNSLELGFLYKGKAESKDVVSLLVYLANKRYVSISEYESKVLFSNKKGFKITKLKDYDGDNEYERIFLDGLFKYRSVSSIINSIDDDKSGNDIKNGIFVTSEDLYNKFYTTTNKILYKINDKENKNKIFEKNGTWGKILMILMIIVIFILITVRPVIEYSGTENIVVALLFPGIAFSVLFGMLIGNTTVFEKIFGLVWGVLFGGIPLLMYVFPSLIYQPAYFVSYIIGIVCVAGIILCIKYLPKRTAYGNEILGKIRGFKRFLEIAEKPKLEALVMENPTYFYDILPYTYVLGVSDRWIKKFESISISSPDWYDSPSAFDIATFGRFMNSTMSSATTSMTSSPSSSSSGGGSSGGGSSGGGSGGGGGGSW